MLLQCRQLPKCEEPQDRGGKERSASFAKRYMGLYNVGRLDEFMWGQIGMYRDYKVLLGYMELDRTV